MFTPIINQARTNAASQIKSTAPVDPRVIAETAYKGKISRDTAITAQEKVLRDQIKEAAERDISQYATSIGEQNKQAYQEALAFEERKLEEKYNDIQNRINEGGNYKKLEAEWNSYKTRADKRLTDKAAQLDKQAQSKLTGYAKSWEETTGKSMANNAGIILRSTDRLIRLSPKQLAKKFGKSFVVGAGVGGAVAGAAQLGKVAVSATAGAVLTGVGAGLSLGSGYATAAWDVKQGRLNRDEFAVEGGARAVEGGVSFLGGFSGAVAGAGAVTAASNLVRTGNIKGVSAAERQLATRAYEKNGLAMRQVKGKITEGKIRASSFSKTGKDELLKEIKAGSTIRKTTMTPNTKGLSSAEIKALAKYKIKVEIYSVYNQQGQAIKTIEVARVTGKAPITKIIRGADETISYGRGTIGKSGSEIDRLSLQYKGLGVKDRLTIKGQTGRLREIGFEKVKSVGSVAKGDRLRLEAGVGRSTSLARYNTKTKLLELTPKTTKGSQLILSDKSSVKLLGATRGNIKISQSSTTYRDVLGLGTSRNIPTPSPSKLLISPSTAKPSSSTGLFAKGSTTSGGATKLKSLNVLGGGSKSAPVTTLSPSTQQAAANIFATTPTTKTTSIFSTPQIISRSKTRELSLLQPQEAKTKTITATKTSQRIFSNSLFSGAAVGSAAGVSQASAPAQRQAPLIRVAPPQQATKTQQSLLTPTAPASNSLFKPAPIAAGGGFGVPLGFLGRVKVGGGGFNRRTRGSLFGKTAYSASLGSVLTGYSKKGDARKLSKQTFSGIGLRPQLENSPKKKKKKKKK